MKTGVGKFGLAPFIAVMLLSISGASAAQVPNTNAEALVNCPVVLELEPLVPYGFAKAALVSLWYARSAALRSAEINQAANESSNYFTLMTAMMRITKMSTNDFVCAKRAVKPFAVEQNGENIKISADGFVDAYDAHIAIDQRMLELFKKLDRTSQVEIMDQLSTFQVERGQKWADLVEPTTLTLMTLIDVSRPDENGKLNRLVLTKAQKKALLDWAIEHFPEIKNGTPQDQWSDPAKTAQLYFKFLNGRKSADE